MDENKMKEIYMEYQMIDQHTKQMQQQLEAVTSQLMDLTVAMNGLDEFAKVKEGKEIFVPISAGIFAKAEVKNTSELLVNVGAGVAVTKDIPSTKGLIGSQVDELRRIQRQMIEELEKFAQRASEIEKHIESSHPGKNQ